MDDAGWFSFVLWFFFSFPLFILFCIYTPRLMLLPFIQHNGKTVGEESRESRPTCPFLLILHYCIPCPLTWISISYTREEVRGNRSRAARPLFMCGRRKCAQSVLLLVLQ